MHGVYRRIRVERNQKFALLKGNSIYFIWWCRNTQIGTYRVVLQISWAVRNSGFVVIAVLSVKIDGSIALGHDYLLVVFWKNFEFYYFAIQSSQTFQGQLRGIVDFNLGSIDAGGDDVSLILGDFDLVGSNIKLKILDELDSSFELIVVSQRFTTFLGFVDKLTVCFSCGHVVGLNSIYFGDFVHQQSILLILDSLCYDINF